MSRVQVVFTSEQRGSASDALRVLGVMPGQGGVYDFDDVRHDVTARLTELTSGADAFVVPTRNILLVRVRGGAKS